MDEREQSLADIYRRLIRNTGPISLTQFMGEAKPLKIGESTFYQMDAINSRLPDSPTKQRYICGLLGEHFVYFVFSYNGETDPEFMKMMEVVKSFRVKGDR